MQESVHRHSNQTYLLLLRPPAPPAGVVLATVAELEDEEALPPVMEWSCWRCATFFVGLSSSKDIASSSETTSPFGRLYPVLASPKSICGAWKISDGADGSAVNAGIMSRYSYKSFSLKLYEQCFTSQRLLSPFQWFGGSRYPWTWLKIKLSIFYWILRFTKLSLHFQSLYVCP